MRKAKNVVRRQAGLTLCEDTLKTSRGMRAAAPPSVLPLMAAAMAGDCVAPDGSVAPRRGRPMMARRQLACMRSSDSDEKPSDSDVVPTEKDYDDIISIAEGT